MRRTYISPEFNYNRVFGTFNMREESTFFGSKMLEIEDNLNLHNQGIIYYQNSNSEQIDLSIENSLTPIVYSTSDDKKNNHTLVIDDSQSDSQRNTQTRYILNINLSIILRNFLFATLKQYRTFEGIRNNMCYSGDINTSIKEYIEKNVVDRYRFEKTVPDFMIGFFTNFRYKKWTAGFSVRTEIGRYVYNNINSSRGFYSSIPSQDFLTNLNYNAETLADIAKPVLSGTQVIIQFKDDEGKSVGVQVSVDSFSTKADLNKMLQEFLADRFDSEDDPNQIY